jgi:ABC-2 type transport system ATP-binding protein
MIKQKITALRDEGKTILLSTHQLAEAQTLCDHFVLINRGKLVLKGTLEQIRKDFYKNMIVVETVRNPQALKNLPKVRKIEIRDKKAYIYLDGESPVKEIMRDIINAIDVVSMETHKPSLYDIFMQTVNSTEK